MAATIQLIPHLQIDKVKWDNRILNASNGLVYAQSWYLDTVCPLWSALIIGDYEVIMPICTRKKWGITYLFQPYFTQQLGIFSDNDKLINQYQEYFIAYITKKYSYIDIQLNYANKISNQNCHYRSNFELRLNKPSDEIISNYSHGIKDNLRKAKKQNYDLQYSTHYQDLIDFFIAHKGNTFEHIKAKDYQILSKICAIATAKNLLKCCSIHNDKQAIIASGLFIHFKNRIIFINGTANEEGRKRGALSWLIHQHIMQNANQELIFDFEGSVNTSLGKFYKSFGSKDMSYPKLKFNKLPWFIKLFKS
jgi:hypothetical protein